MRARSRLTPPPLVPPTGKYIPHPRKRQEKIAGSLKFNWVQIPHRALDEKTRKAVESTELPEPLIKPHRVQLKARHKEAALVAEAEAEAAAKATEEAEAATESEAKLTQ